MRVNPVCSKCKTDLEIKDTYVSSIGTVIIEVVSCANINCYDCSNCDSVLKQKNSELKTRNKELKNKLSRIAGEAVK